MGFGKDGKGVILREVATITVGALAAGAVVKHSGGVVLETTSFRILKTEYFAVMSTAFQGEFDQILLGIANGALTTTQIAEAIEVNGPDDRNDRVEAEQAMRAVWLVNHLQEQGDSANAIQDQLNNGNVMHFSLKWTFTPTEGWDWFAFNPLGAAITTGPVIKIFAKHFGVWVD